MYFSEFLEKKTHSTVGSKSSGINLILEQVNFIPFSDLF